MNDQRTDRSGGGLMANVWLNSVVIFALLVAAFIQGVHAWDGGSYRAAAGAILAVACICLLSLNIVRGRRKK
jgi:hypothetical protein